MKPSEVEFVTLANIQPHICLQSVTTIQARRGCSDVICCTCTKCCVVIVTSADSTENIQMGRESAVGIATRYGLDGPGIESRWGRDFPGAHPISYKMGTGSFPGVKRPGRNVDHPPTSSTEVEGRVELYICSPSGSLWPVLG